MTSSESHVVAAWTWKTIFASYPTFILLFSLRTISDTELSFLDITLGITDDHISTTVYYKDTDTHTYLHHQSSHPSHCKKGLPRSQLLRLRRLCSEDSDFLEKGGEMVSFFEQRGYSPACLQNDLQAIRRLDRAGVLNNHNPSNQRSERIPSDSSQSSVQAGTSPCLHARCRACHYISSDTSVRGSQYSFVIKKAFSC